MAMRNVIKAAIVALALALASPVAAQDFDTGWKAYQRGDYELALQEFRPLADQGSAEAQFSLGWMIFAGEGVQENCIEGVKWWRKAAEQGYAPAQNSMGYVSMGDVCFEGEPHDYLMAYMWFELATSQGEEPHPVIAMSRDLLPSLMTSEQVDEAEKLVCEWPNKRSAETAESATTEAPKDIEAFTEAVREYSAGLEAYQSGDYAAALREWRPLAKQGNASAQYKLGAMYSLGQGVSQDYSEARRWYRKSADQGLGEAQYNLGLMHGLGQGGPKDFVRAHMWWNLAAKH